MDCAPANASEAVNDFYLLALSMRWIRNQHASRQSLCKEAIMKTLITGGAGFIGSNLVRYLIRDKGCSVLSFDALTYAGNLHSLSDVADHPKYKFVHGDIRRPDSIAVAISEFQPDVVMHLAAESHVDRSISNPSMFVETNVIGTCNVLNASLEYWQQLAPDLKPEFRFLHVSTDEVFGSLGETGFFDEETSYDPRSPYSASKAASDHLARAWHHTYGLPILITNCSNNYGPFQFPEKLIPVVILKCINEEEIPVYGRGENVRDWLFVGDHCSALWTVARKGKSGETYAIGGNNELRNIDLVNLICDKLDQLRPRRNGKSYRELIAFVQDRPGHDKRYAIDATKIRDELGWQPTPDAAKTFEDTIVWYLENESWWRDILNGNYRLERLGTL